MRRLTALVFFFASFTALPRDLSPDLYSGMRWRMIGPFRGGRTVAAAGVPGKPNVFYIGAVNGGVWKTTDYGRVWKPVFDAQPTGSIGALAVAPSKPDVVYAGSGEGLQRPDLSVGDGIYRSDDAGGTWQHLGLREGQQIAALLVDPHDARRVFAAVLGHPYGPNEERGVFRSNDGGATWTRILYRGENTGAVDLAFDPKNPDIVYAVLWEARQGPWENGEYQGAGSGLYRSSDGGATWTQLRGGLPGFERGLGRIGIGVAPSDGNRIYALVSARDGGLYRSDDAGSTWKRVNAETRLWGRGNDFAGVRVDPTNPDVVYVANTSTYRSTDGGMTFTAVKGAPGGDDYHTIWINPRNPRIILLASDQGATISVNGGETWSSWYNQPTAQFYHVSTDNRFPYWVYGGQQESGSAAVRSRGDSGEITVRDWHPVGVEEYGYVAPDPLHPGVVFGGKLTRYDEATGMVQDVGPVVLADAAYRFLRTAPVLFSPTDPHTLYLAGNVLFKTVDGGHHWSIISPDLSRERWDVPAPVGVFRDEAAKRDRRRRGVIYTIAPSPLDGKKIWAGTDDGLIHVTTDGGAHWSDVTPPEVTAWSKVSLIEASHFDAGTAYAAVNRFRLDDLHPYIYRTVDGGKTWKRITSGLPDDEPVNAVREDPSRRGLLFAATERAAYVSFDDGQQWLPLKLNMPPTSVRDIVIHGDDLVAGTHGRGFWILDDITPLRQATEAAAERGAFLFEPEVAYRVRRSQNTDTPLPPEEPAGQNPPDGAVIDYWLPRAAGGAVALEISDTQGHVIRRFESTDKPEPDMKALGQEMNAPLYWVRRSLPLAASAGMHRFVWDLHGPEPRALRTEYPISAIAGDTPRYPQGPAAMPGRYTVKLMVDGKTYSRALTVKMDPRVETPAADLRLQATLASEICEWMGRDVQALEEVRAARKRLPGKAADARAIETQLAALEGAGGGRRAGGAPGLMRLNSELAAVLEIVNGADAAPTRQVQAAAASLKSELDRLLSAWNGLRGRIP